MAERFHSAATSTSLSNENLMFELKHRFVCCAEHSDTLADPAQAKGGARFPQMLQKGGESQHHPGSD
jgi:hypothetical protein